jgi:hypothetical protein
MSFTIQYLNTLGRPTIALHAGPNVEDACKAAGEKLSVQSPSARVINNDSNAEAFLVKLSEHPPGYTVDDET